MSSLAYVLATVTAPIAFATRARTARQLFEFALAEHESMLELRAAAARSPSPERRALYLRHALDEERHATAFSRHSAEIRRALGLPAYGQPRTDCEALYERLGEQSFLAFVHRGEHRGRVQFDAYVAFFARRGDAKLRALFTALIEDERRHESYTRALLVEHAGSDRGAQRVLFTMAMWEGFRRWRRAGQGLARLVYGAAMLVLYAALLPFAVLLRLLRPEPKARGGWEP
jgi:rubrerythrin